MVKFAPLLLSAVAAQQAGDINSNDLVPFAIGECKSDGTCVENKKTKLSLDSNWRWTHQAGGSENCYTSNEWKTKGGEQVCEDGQTKTCAKKCAVGNWPKEQWEAPYGVNKTASGVKLGYVTQGPYSINVGTRLFVTEEDEYKQFDLIGKEVSITVDMSGAECGLNGAIYLVEMDPKGDKGVGDNEAGAPYGTGYCDAQCPRDLKWIKGKANIKPKWVPNQKDPMKNIGEGGRGICCAELDLWEANKMSMQLALHPMKGDNSQEVCYLDAECGSQEAGKRDLGPTDRNGCYLNPYALGHKKFYGPGSDFTINTKKPFTIVTEFREKSGELHGMYQYYYQDGKKIEFPDLGLGSGNSMTESFCKNLVDKYGEEPYFQNNGGLKQFSKAVKRGMTFVISFWDDMATNMNWLDTGSRGTCDPQDGVTVEIKARKVRVKGPRGVLLRDFKHLSLEMEVLPPLEENGPKRIRVQKWFGSTRELAAVQSVCSHINNMFTGVQRGYKYTMKLVYAHFPINVNPIDGGKSLEIRNFLGEKVIRRVPMKEGVKVDKTGNKDEIALEGNSIENVGSSASLIHQVCMVKRKDIRKFLDGVYVSEKSNIDPE